MSDIMKYDYSELLGKIKAKKISQEELARQIRLNPSTLSKKLNGKSEFTQNEMKNILSVIDVPLEKITFYFYCSKTLENAS